MSSDPSAALSKLSSDYRLDIGPMFSEIGKNYMPMLGPMLGFIAILIVAVLPFAGINFVLNFIPIIGSLLSSLITATVMTPLAAGTLIVTLAQLRGQPWTFGDFFGGFRMWVPIYTIGAVNGIVSWICFLPSKLLNSTFYLLLRFEVISYSPTITVIVGGLSFLLIVLGLTVLVWVSIRYLTLAPFLVIEHKVSGIDAIKACPTVMQGHFWMWLLLLILFGLIGAGGIVGCGIGILFTIPIFYILFTAAYLQTTQPAAPPQ